MLQSTFVPIRTLFGRMMYAPGLRLVVGHGVPCVTVWLARKCRNCRYVFTDYPDFRTPPALPGRPCFISPPAI